MGTLNIKGKAEDRAGSKGFESSPNDRSAFQAMFFNG
jgi:hypothetical protein